MKAALFGLSCLLILGCGDMQRPAGQNTTAAKRPVTTPNQAVLEPDNTGVNARDQKAVTKTPIDQDEDKEDVRITADIRKRVVDTKMSINAQNAKIITQDGKVTLRGPVESDEERQTIADIATDVAGAGNVINELEVSKN